MPVPALFIIIFLFIFISLLSWSFYNIDKSYGFGKQHPWWVRWGSSAILFISLSWFVIYCCQPVKVAKIETYKFNKIKLADGKDIFIAAYNDPNTGDIKYINGNEEFGIQIDPEKMYLQVTFDELGPYVGLYNMPMKNKHEIVNKLREKHGNHNP